MPYGDRTIWKVYGCILHFNFLFLLWLEVGRDYQAGLATRKTLKLSSKTVGVETWFYLLRVFKRDQIIRAEEEENCIASGDGESGPTDQGETACLESRPYRELWKYGSFERLGCA